MLEPLGVPAVVYTRRHAPLEGHVGGVPLGARVSALLGRRVTVDNPLPRAVPFHPILSSSIQPRTPLWPVRYFTP
ncbi:MAG: hypothetical protein ACLPZR_23790 [Solirubrobacteraceae bacterium]